MAQQVTVGAGIIEALVAGPVFLTQGQRDGTIREPVMDLGDDFDHAIIGEIGIFATLQDKGPVAEFIARLAALDDFVLAEAVAVDGAIAGADAAIIAVIGAIVGKLNQAADENATAIEPVSKIGSRHQENLAQLGIGLGGLDDPHQSGGIEGCARRQAGDGPDKLRWRQ